MIEAVKLALRVSTDAFDSEITDLIAMARADLVRAGILPEKAKLDTDPLIRRAIIWYCKAHFGFDNPDAQRYADAYDTLRVDLALCKEYTDKEETP